jgi:hypothetical protein
MSSEDLPSRGSVGVRDMRDPTTPPQVAEPRIAQPGKAGSGRVNDNHHVVGKDMRVDNRTLKSIFNKVSNLKRV